MSAFPHEAESPSDRIDVTLPHCARVWDYWVGGTDNYPCDRHVGDQVMRRLPAIVTAARNSRGFVVRASRYLAAEAGVRQFLDIGAGLPTADNTHQVAQRVVPDARVVYVDNDPLVLAHARALLTGTPEGAAHYVEADLRHPDRILREATRLLDLSRPVALMLVGIMGHIEDYLEAREIVDRLSRALPTGSYLAMYDGTDVDTAGRQAVRQYNQSGPLPYILRTPEQVRGFFDGLVPVEPGLVPPTWWRPGPGDEIDARDTGVCGLARKP